MHSNLDRLTSMLLIASAITFAGATSPAQAARHHVHTSYLQAGSFTTSAQWSEGYGYVRHRHHAHSRTENWSAENWGAHDDWGRADSGWSNSTSNRSSASRETHRKVRVASLGRGTYGATGGGSDVVMEARRWLGTNPTGWSHVWCGRFMNFVLERTGRHGTGSNLAFSFANYGHHVSGPQVGAIAVMGRRGGGHVGVVSGVDSGGNPIIISGNFRHTVAEVAYPRSRIVAYVMP
jgi:uncharacterized protein (TIGR02594 family)